jgi:FkbM family methyltransferase
MPNESKLPVILTSHCLNCIDVGARGGMQRHWRPYVEAIQNIDLFEPDEAACEKQAQRAEKNESWFPVALGGVTGTGRLHVTQRPSGSSLYRPNEDVIFRFAAPSYGKIAKILDVPLMTLSDFIDKYQRPLPNLLKLDVQGAELDILKNTRQEHWHDLLAVQAEVEFVSFYEGQPLFHDVDAFMRQQGYVMFDMLPVRAYRFEGENSHGLLRRHLNLAKNRSDISRRFIEADVLYLRAPEEVLAQGDVGRILKLFIILLLYRFFDEALWLAESAAKAGHVSAEQMQDLIAVVKQAAPKLRWTERADWLGKMSRRFTKRFGIGRARKMDYWLERSWDF